MTGAQDKKFDFKKFINPPMLATLTAVLLMFLGVGQKIPVTLLNPVKMLGNCLLPLVMLVLGGNFALTNLKNVQMADVISVEFGELGNVGGVLTVVRTGVERGLDAAFGEDAVAGVDRLRTEKSLGQQSLAGFRRRCA